MSVNRLDSHSAWTQIRSFIKGSAEAVVKGRGLTENEFVENAAFNNRSRLDATERLEVVRIASGTCLRRCASAGATTTCSASEPIFESSEWDYRRSLWDDSDRARCIASAALSRGWREGVAPFDRVYVDEVQDSTQVLLHMILEVKQAEIVLMLLACGADPRRLWLAGDTAQAITYGPRTA